MTTRRTIGTALGAVVLLGSLLAGGCSATRHSTYRTTGGAWYTDARPADAYDGRVYDDRYEDPYSPEALRERYGDPIPDAEIYGPGPGYAQAPMREPQYHGPPAPAPLEPETETIGGTMPTNLRILSDAGLKRYGDLGAGEVYPEGPSLETAANVNLLTVGGAYVSHDCYGACDHIYCANCGAYHDSLRYYTYCAPKTRFSVGYSYSSGYGSSLGLSFGWSWWDWYDWDYYCRAGYTPYYPSYHWRYTYRPYCWWGWSTGWSYSYRDYRWCDPYPYRTRYWYTGGYYGGSYYGYNRHYRGDYYYTDKYGYDWIGAQRGLAPAVPNNPFPRVEGAKIQQPRLMSSRRGDQAREERYRNDRFTEAPSRLQTERAARGETATRSDRAAERDRQVAPTRSRRAMREAPAVPDRSRRTAQPAPPRAETPTSRRNNRAAASNRREMAPAPNQRRAAPPRSQPQTRSQAPTRSRADRSPAPSRREMRPAPSQRRQAAPSRSSRPPRASAPTRTSRPTRASAPSRSRGGGQKAMPSRRGNRGGRGG